MMMYRADLERTLHMPGIWRWIKRKLRMDRSPLELMDNGPWQTVTLGHVKHSWGNYELARSAQARSEYGHPRWYDCDDAALGFFVHSRLEMVREGNALPPAIGAVSYFVEGNRKIPHMAIIFWDADGFPCKLEPQNGECSKFTDDELASIFQVIL